ncbi:hypothetical protein [Kitasatospora aureofaciens]|uniref:hypothetical protein n=1 Tax=Kitasatospora aureofaciens TaxID=1894 RepID=UPI000524B106|nr:hypothetical protein [Kitasatospora aureofaciens]
MADLSKHPPEAQPVFDPALPDVTRAAVAELAAHHPDLLAEGDESAELVASYTGASRLLRRSAMVAAAGVSTALGTFLLGHFLDQPKDVDTGSYATPHHSLEELIRDLLTVCENLGLVLLVGGALVATMAILLAMSENRHIDRMLEQARGHYVHPHWLTNDAALLLGRAQRAAASILGSRLHQDDPEGLGTANTVQLPERLWTIADSLRRYSKAAKDGAAASADDPVVNGMLASERKVYDSVLAGVEAQVVALEEYALQAWAVDRIAADRAVVEQVEARSEAVRDLLAEAAAVPAGVAEISALTTSATAVTEAFTEALGAAMDAAAAALPPADRPRVS